MFDQQEEPQYRTIRIPESDDLDLLIALASMFYLYHKFEKAISVLAVARHLEAENRSVMELQAVIFSEMQRYSDALRIITEIEKITTDLPVELNAVKKRAIRFLQTES